ncbi:unnamed protein product [Amoebophrya sp. A25]|nr:unnamed protein product [Amoebophrya sp. A25]|eukprot:GSA25T00023270001.1
MPSPNEAIDNDAERAESPTSPSTAFPTAGGGGGASSSTTRPGPSSATIAASTRRAPGSSAQLSSSSTRGRSGDGGPGNIAASQRTAAEYKADLRLKESQLKHVSRQVATLLKDHEELVAEKRSLQHKFSVQTTSAREEIEKLTRRNRNLNDKLTLSNTARGTTMTYDSTSSGGAQFEPAGRSKGPREMVGVGVGGASSSSRNHSGTRTNNATSKGVSSQMNTSSSTTLAHSPIVLQGARSGTPTRAGSLSNSGRQRRSASPEHTSYYKNGGSALFGGAGGGIRNSSPGAQRAHLLHQQHVAKLEDEFAQLLATHENYVLLFTEVLRKKEELTDMLRDEFAGEMQRRDRENAEKRVRLQRIHEEEKKLLESECSAFIAQREVEWEEEKKSAAAMAKEWERERDEAIRKMQGDRETHHLELEHWKRKHSFYKDRFAEAEKELSEQIEEAKKMEQLAKKRADEIEEQNRHLNTRMEKKRQEMVADATATENTRMQAVMEHEIARVKLACENEKLALTNKFEHDKMLAVNESEKKKNAEASERLRQSEDRLNAQLKAKDQEIVEVKKALKHEAMQDMEKRSQEWEELREKELQEEKRRADEQRRMIEREHMMGLQELKSQHELAMASTHGNLLEQVDSLRKERDSEKEKRIQIQEAFQEVRQARQQENEEAAFRLELWFQGYQSVRHTKLAQEAFRRALSSDPASRRMPSLTERFAARRSAPMMPGGPPASGGAMGAMGGGGGAPAGAGGGMSMMAGMMGGDAMMSARSGSIAGGSTIPSPRTTARGSM